MHARRLPFLDNDPEQPGLMLQVLGT